METVFPPSGQLFLCLSISKVNFKCLSSSRIKSYYNQITCVIQIPVVLTKSSMALYTIYVMETLIVAKLPVLAKTLSMATILMTRKVLLPSNENIAIL